MKRTVLLLSLLLLPVSASAENACLAWTGSPDQVDGYKIYYDNDTSGTPYSNVIDVGMPAQDPVTGEYTYTIQNIQMGTNWFAVTAYATVNGVQVESGYSNEISGVFGPNPPGGLHSCTP